MRSLWVAALVLLAAPIASATPLALAYSVPGSGGVLESFDSMGATGTNAPGQVNGAGWDSYWSVDLQGATPRQQYTSLALPNANPALDAYNGGAVGDADRALGLYTTAASNPTRNLDARFRNDGSAALSAFYLEFDVEFWLQRAQPRWTGIQAFYSTDGTTWINLGNGFEATLVNTTTTAGFVDGNLPANSVRGVGGLIDLVALGQAPIAVGDDFFLRFSSSAGLTVPGGLAANQNRNMGAFLDDLWVGTTPRSLVPEAHTAALLGLGLGGIAWRGRKR
ncbi:MAG: hypothetical protein MUF70_05820 [Myxococcota bacterium]|jgi:hypothetical protein|nr:hypothetical protein [Myxococcota bacterium]